MILVPFPFYVMRRRQMQGIHPNHALVNQAQSLSAGEPGILLILILTVILFYCFQLNNHYQMCRAATSRWQIKIG